MSADPRDIVIQNWLEKATESLDSAQMELAIITFTPDYVNEQIANCKTFLFELKQAMSESTT